MDIIEDPFENIDDLLNFSCGDFEGDNVQGESISDIFSRCNDIPTEFYLPYEDSAYLEHLSTFFGDSCFLGSVAVDKGSSVKNYKNKQNCDSGHFHTPSPVSVLDSSSSPQVVKTMPIKRPRTATFIHRPIISLMPLTSLSNDLVLPFLSEYKTMLRRPNSVATESMKRKKVIMSPMPGSFEQSVSQQTHSVQKCLHCRTRETPQERMGPLGLKTLCNAYGVRYKLGQMFPENQPTASPTYHGTSLNKNNDSCNFQTPSSVSFHDSSSSHSDVETTSIKPEIVVWDKTHSKRPRTAAFSSPPVLPPVAVEAKKRKKVKLLPVSGPLEHCDSKRTKSVPKCLCCETKKMPKGRVGPLRPRTLRNAYGVRYKLGRLFAESPPARPKTLCNTRGVPYNLGGLLPEHQPAASPTFEDSVNTNKNNDSNHFQMLSSVVFLSSSSSSCSEVETMPINPETVSPGYPHSELPCMATSIAQPVIPLVSHTLSTDPVPTLPSFQSFSKELERLSEFETTNIKVTENFISPPVVPLVSPTSSPDQLQPFLSEVFSKGTENLSGCGITNSKAHTEIPCTETFISTPVIPLTSPTSSTNQVTPFPSELYSIEIEKFSEVRTAQNILGPVATELKKRKSVKLSPKPHSIKKSPSKQTKPVRKCSHCEIMATPQWRTGPLGPKTLCNACGFRYKMGSLFPEYRPSASPTFVKTLHSNKNRTVLEIRSKSDQDMAKFWSNYT